MKIYYSCDEIKSGFISAPDRRGIVRNIPLLSTAIVILEAPRGRVKYGIEDVSHLIFKLKKEAKAQGDFIVAATLMLS